jgi:hypothetical protein
MSSSDQPYCRTSHETGETSVVHATEEVLSPFIVIVIVIIIIIVVFTIQRICTIWCRCTPSFEKTGCCIYSLDTIIYIVGSYTDTAMYGCICKLYSQSWNMQLMRCNTATTTAAKIT